MEFRQYYDSIYWAKRTGISQFFQNKAEVLDLMIQYAEEKQNPYTWRRAIMEKAWIKKERPYYKVYPAILPMLVNFHLDVPCSALLEIPVAPIELRLPTQDTKRLFTWTDITTGEECRIEGILIGIQQMPTKENSDTLTKGLVICFDPGERDDSGAPIISLKYFPLNKDMTVHETSELLKEHSSWREGMQVPQAIVSNIIKLATCVCLIGNDPSIISPDLLAKDEKRWDTATEQERDAMVAMARRRGKFGWSIGYNMEVSPHYRSAHLARVWTGTGRTTPKIVLRKGTVVHRQKLTTLPSGYDSQDNEQGHL